MKYTITVDENRDEEILIFVHKKTELTDKIEALIKEADSRIIGYQDSEITILDKEEICCFIVENNKVFALTQDEKFLIKARLYQLNEKLGRDFIQINQSSIANLKKIKKFDSSIGGTLKVIFKNGYVDYVSRRNLKSVKERMGI